MPHHAWFPSLLFDVSGSSRSTVLAIGPTQAQIPALPLPGPLCLGAAILRGRSVPTCRMGELHLLREYCEG